MPRSKAEVERIAVLETQMSSVRQTQKEILDKQSEILLELAKYRGAFGIALLIVTAVGTALVFFKDAILTKFGLKG